MKKIVWGREVECDIHEQCSGCPCEGIVMRCPALQEIALEEFLGALGLFADEIEDEEE